MVILAATQESAVQTRERLGSIPKDAYAQNGPYIPNSLAPSYERADIGDTVEVAGGQDVFAIRPVFDDAGDLVITTKEVELRAEQYSPVKRTLGSALLGGLTAGLLTGTKLGPVAGLVGFAAGAVVAGSTGYLTSVGDQVSLEYVTENVYDQKLTGFKHGQLDGAFVPRSARHKAGEQPKPWFQQGMGNLHYYIPVIEQEKVGEISVPQVKHSQWSPETSALIALGSGGVAGVILSSIL